jgi:molybdate transport system substrate-binding protein
MTAAIALAWWLGSPPPAPPEALQVFAAASLSDALREVAALYEAAHPGLKVELAFAGSQALRTQIEHGAEADVFASADRQPAEALQASGLLGATEVFARNRLVVVASRGGRARLARLEDLSAAGVKLVVAGPAVPAGRYTRQLLEKLAAGPLGPEFVRRVEANVVSQETHVRAVLAKLTLGEADAGFVYASDAAIAEGLRVLELPEAAQVVAEYPVGVLSRSSRTLQARAFVALLLGPAGQAVLRRHGFSP